MEFYIYLAYALLFTFAFSFGACIGSFLNVLIYRVPRGESFIRGRSRCPSCAKQIAPRDLIPLLNYMVLRGKCRNCKSIISIRYPLVELLSGLLGILVYIHYDFSLTAIPVFLFGALLIAVAIVDLDTMTIPDGFVIALIPFAPAFMFLFPETDLKARMIGFFCVSLPMLLLAVIISGSFGGGDIKLMAICGFLLGWELTLLAMFIAIMLGGGSAIFFLASGRAKKGSHLPFGPALCLGCFVSLLWGEPILRLYFNLF